MAKLVHIAIDRCNNCPYFRRKGDRLGHGTRQKNACTQKEGYEPEGNYIVKIPFWCPLPDIQG